MGKNQRATIKAFNERPMASGLKARYPGVCPICGKKWRKGTLIQTNPWLSQRELRPVWQHSLCPI